MTLEFRSSGSLFDTLAEPRPWWLWLVDPVCCVPGVMGKGLALEFKRRWPTLVKTHRMDCESGLLEPGRPTCKYVDWDHSVGVILFPTKDDWRRPSQLEWIEAGLAKLVEIVGYTRTHWTLAVPALGAGLGGLDWSAVRPLIEAAAAAELPKHRWIVYEPQ
jgi:hypothetical protein